MGTHVVGFALGLVLLAGIAEVGRRYGSRAEKRLERAVWTIVGAFVGLILLGLIWSTFSS
jgi:hypothetical protein